MKTKKVILGLILGITSNIILADTVISKIVIFGSASEGGAPVAYFNKVIVDGRMLPDSIIGQNYTVPANAKLVITDINISPRTKVNNEYQKSFDIRYLPAEPGHAFEIAAIYNYHSHDFMRSLTTGIVIPGGKRPFMYCDNCASYNSFNVTLNGYLEVTPLNIPTEPTLPNRPTPTVPNRPIPPIITR